MAPRLLPNRWLSAKSIRAAVENGSRRSGGGADHVPGVCGILGTSVVEAPAEGGGADHAQEVCGILGTSEFGAPPWLSLIHISEPTRRTPISYAVFCLKK